MVAENKQNNIQLINNFLNQSIMKKSLFAILAAAACLASCSEVIDSPVVGNPISFDNYVGKDAVTRAAVVSNVSSVNVNAYLHKATTSNGANFVANFMSAQTVTKEGDKWVYSPTKYWPASDQVVDFVAWINDAPEGVASNIEIETNADGQYTSIMNFTVADVVTNQTDLLVATPVLDQNRTLDNSAVNLTFKHLLSRIGFEIQPTGLPAEDDQVNIVELEYVRLNGQFAKSGEVDMTAASPAVSGTVEDVTYELTGANFGYTDNRIKPTNAANTDNSYIMLIPQGNVPESITVKYTVTTKETGKPDVVIENESEFPLNSDPSTPFAYEAGKAYKYIFKITMAAIEFSVTETPWDETLTNPGTDITPEPAE